MNAKLSIITVCRNEAARIRQTAESVVGQTSADFEWIVIDGGSTDGTLEVLKSYRSRMAYFVSEPDGGIYDAMNKGSRQATGSHMLFLNGGDRLVDAEVLASLMPWMAGNPDLIMGDYCLEYPDGRCDLRKSSQDPVTAHRLYRLPLAHSATLIRTGLFKAVGEYDTSFRIMGDVDWFIRAFLRHGATAVPVHRTISVFNGEGISSNLKNSPVFRGERRRINRKYYPWGYGLRWAVNEAVGRVQSALKSRRRES